MKTVARTFALLKILSDYGELSLKEIAASLNLPVGKCWNLVQAVVASGYAVKVRHGHYALSGKVAALTHRQTLVLPEELKQLARRLAGALKEQVIVAGLRHTTLELLYSVSCDGENFWESPGGVVASGLYEWAAGRALLAENGEAFVKMYLAGHALLEAQVWPEADGHDALLTLCAQIREQGLAQRVTQEEMPTFSAAVALDSRYAVGVAYPAAHQNSVFHAALIDQLTAARRKWRRE